MAVRTSDEEVTSLCAAIACLADKGCEGFAGERASQRIERYGDVARADLPQETGRFIALALVDASRSTFGEFADFDGAQAERFARAVEAFGIALDDGAFLGVLQF